MPKKRSTILNNKKRYQTVPKKDVPMKRWLDSTRQFNKDFAGDLPTYEQYRNMPRKAKRPCQVFSCRKFAVDGETYCEEHLKKENYKFEIPNIEKQGENYTFTPNEVDKIIRNNKRFTTIIENKTNEANTKLSYYEDTIKNLGGVFEEKER